MATTPSETVRLLHRPSAAPPGSFDDQAPFGLEVALGRLIDLLATRVAEELELRETMEPVSSLTPTRALLTLDELVAELPTGKRPETWKRWLYERTRRGEVPGCVKLGGTLFFDAEAVREWIAAGAPSLRPTRSAS